MPSLEPNLSKESLENRIGLYWLHRIGVASLVLGFVFLILYSIQFCLPVIKLAMALIASATMIICGDRMAQRGKQPWYGQGLVGGGWSLAYFTTYAAHNVPSVQVVTSLPLATLLLIAVATGALFSALRANSELMAILSVGLAGLSILVSNHASLVGDIPFVIIAFSAAFLGNRKNCNTLLAFALPVCYIGHVYSTSGLALTADTDPLVILCFLAALWLPLACGLGFSSSTTVNTRRFRIILAVINAVEFCWGLHSVASRLSPQVEELMFAGAGAVYLGIARWLRKRNSEDLSTAHTLLGLVLVNGAKAMRYSGVTAVTVDVMQIALLSVIGRRYAIPAFRWFAVILTCLLFPYWLFSMSNEYSVQTFGIHAIGYFKSGLVAVLVLGAMCYEHQVRSGLSQNRSWCFYYLTANLMFAMLIGLVESVPWQAFLIASQAVANHVVYIKTKDALPALLGALALLSALAVGLGSVCFWTIPPMILMVSALWAGYFWTRKFKGIYNIDAGILNVVYGLSASSLLALLIWQKAPAAYISLELGFEAIALLIVGFSLQDRLVRLYGLGVLALVAAKLLFIDAAHYNTIERVSSFIAAGAVFLLSSFAYTKFTDGCGRGNETETGAASEELGAHGEEVGAQGDEMYAPQTAQS